MNENELKTRLQQDAERFSPSFDEKLCSRIMHEISMMPEPERRSASRRFPFQYVVLICSSICIGIGTWSLMRHHPLTTPVPIRQTAVSSCCSDSMMNVMPSQVALSPNPTPVSVPPPLQTQPSVSNVPNGTVFDLSVPKAPQLEELPMVLIPGLGLVRLNRHTEPQLENQTETPAEIQIESENQPVSNFWNDASEVVRVPVDWILEE